ncbi:hypothetical protein LTR85_004240 [Meristemomyces frigidus]|nr:hypothetical protein LTR85_004240 [Meristemomyces frigidus]
MTQEMEQEMESRKLEVSLHLEKIVEHQKAMGLDKWGSKKALYAPAPRGYGFHGRGREEAGEASGGDGTLIYGAVIAWRLSFVTKAVEQRRRNKQ